MQPNKISSNKNIARQLKGFVLKALLLIVFVFLIDCTIGTTLQYFYFKQESGFLYRTTYAIEKTKADVLIFGSSRASRHYNPNIFKDRIHLSCYNVGHDGNFILYQYAVLNAVLKRYQPKLIILDITRGEFAIRQNDYERLSALLPYYKGHEEIRPIVQLKSPYEKLKTLSFIYPYNSLLFSIAVGNAEFNKQKMKDIDGYVPIDKIYSGSMATTDSLPNYVMDSIKVKTYESFIHDCEKNKIKLVIVCSPYLFKNTNTDNSINLAKAIAIKNKIPFHDFSTDTSFVNHSQLFADSIHLNNGGATIFSNKVIDRILPF
ncbi:MAG: hypothetical protein D4R41_05765 [Sediminibacterium sp.]|nr:MAG: hypothetical protein D4R41_05765 [Sediminibacterium sp.]